MPDNKTITVATDGSDHSLRVLPHAAVLASNLGAGVELLRVIEQVDIASEPGETPSSATERARADIEAAAQAALTRFGVQGTVRVVVAPAGEHPAQTLLNQGSDALVLAMHSHGRGGIGRLLHGSVALGVLQAVRIPVMLGGKELLAPPADGETYRLLATTDLSPDADHALRTIAPLLEQGKFQVTLLYVHLHAPGGVDNDAERAKCEAELAQKRNLLPASVPVETRLREIPIGAGIDTAILEVADEINAQSILMATHGHSARRHLLMGSVAMSILGRSRLPLIVTRAEP